MRTSIVLLHCSFALAGAVALACGSSGSDGAGTGGDAAGGAAGAGAGGSSAATGGGAGTSAGGSSNTGGNATGGSPGSGGTTGSGGRDAGSATGGAAGSGGTMGSGGAAGGGGTGGVRVLDASRDTGSDVGTRGTGGAIRDASVDAIAASDAALAPLTVWIAGDSTVATGTAPCPIGWGGQFKPHFDNRVTVVNSAVAGRSVRDWLYSVQNAADPATGECIIDTDANGQPVLQQRWIDMMNGMKSGDYLFIQFGINDGAPDCSQGRHVGIDTFEMEYGMMAQVAKARGAHPVFLTPVSAIQCGGTGRAVAQPTRGAYVTATVAAGMQFGVPTIDLHALSIALYNSLAFCPLPAGATDVSATTGGAVGMFFCDDHTHFETTGAMQIATLVANAVRTQQLGLAAYLQ